MIQLRTKRAYSLPDTETQQSLPSNKEPMQRHTWKERKKVIVIPLVLLAILLFAILFGPLRWSSGFQWQKASGAMFAHPVSATGFLQAPVYNLNFSSTVTGLVSDIYVQLGQRVVAGQILSHLGYNTYVAQLQEAQIAVDAAHKQLIASEEHVANQFAFINAQVVLAQVTLQAELNNRQALLEQAQANIHFALVTLEKDQATLDAVIKASKTAIKSAKLTEINAIAACKASSSSSDTTAADGTNSNSSVSLCIQAAKATFQAAVASAKEDIVEAQGTVAQDRAALIQAKANANVDLTAANGRIKEAAAGIAVARLNPDRTNALIALAQAELTYRTALAALLITQQTLALTNLCAPHDGVVTAIIGTIGGVPGAVDNLVPAGGFELPGIDGGLTFIQLTDTDHVNRVRTYVDESDIPKVHVGQPATFTLKAYGSHQFTGTVIQIAPNGLGYPGSPTSIKYIAIIAINEDSVGSYVLYHHMTADVTIST